MTPRKLAGLVAQREGKKSQAKIGDIAEGHGHLYDIVAENPEAEACFNAQVQKRKDKIAAKAAKQAARDAKKAAKA